MEKKEEVVKQDEAQAKPGTPRPAAIEGELTFSDLTYVVGGVTLSPILNGRTSGNFKTRFNRRA